MLALSLAPEYLLHIQVTGSYLLQPSIQTDKNRDYTEIIVV